MSLFFRMVKVGSFITYITIWKRVTSRDNYCISDQLFPDYWSKMTVVMISHDSLLLFNMKVEKRLFISFPDYLPTVSTTLLKT